MYQAPGVEGLAPLDAALGLPDEKYTHDLRRIVAEESAKSSFDEVVELIEKRTGASVPKRQVEELTEAILRLRALRASGDFDDYWQFHLVKEHERTHRSRYADRAIPNPLPPARSHLRLVK